MNRVGRAFDKFSLSANQIEKMRNFTKSVLGEDYYVQAERFFHEIWSSNAIYKVFLARRSLNLMYAFYNLYSGGSEELESTFYSDSSLLANVPEIADYYIMFGAFPEVLIIDDILIHGRALNSLIDSLIGSIGEYLEPRNIAFDPYKLERDVLKSLTIRVMVQNSKPTLMNGNYYCLECENIWAPLRWHELSLRISKLVSDGFFSNTSYVLSLYELNENDKNIHTLFADAAKKMGFTRSEWDKRFCRDVWIKPLKNPDGDIAAFYTLHIVQNEIDKRYRIIPFVITSDFEYRENSILSGSGLMFDEYLKEYSEIDGISRNKAEALYLILSHNLLLLLQKECGADDLVEQKRLDIGKIAISFRKPKSSDQTDFFDKLVSLRQPFAEWDEMDELILEATKNSTPLLTESDINSGDIDIEEYLNKKTYLPLLSGSRRSGFKIVFVH